MDRGTWWATVRGVAKSQTQLSINTYHRLWGPGEFWGSVFFRKLKNFLKLFCVYFRKLSLGLGMDGAETGVEGWVMRPSGSLSNGPSWGFLYVLLPCILPVCIPIVSLGRSILPGSKVSSLEFLVSVVERWRRKWQPTPILLPGKSHGWRSLVGYSTWDRRVGHEKHCYHVFVIHQDAISERQGKNQGHLDLLLALGSC